MSRPSDHYETSRWFKFTQWVNGETDPLSSGMEARPAWRKPDWAGEAAENEEKKDVEAGSRILETRGIRWFQRVYRIMSVVLCLSIILALLWTVSALPPFGHAENPANNEVSARYIERGLQETGAVNIVTGMILDYRAFDTFGESCVLFIASCCVLVLLRLDSENGGDRKRKELEENDRVFEPKNDVILQKCACVLVPLIFIFGIYIILNGHLSPGGGFSGGAVLGSGLILYLNAFGFKRTERFFTEKVYRRVTLCALTFYCLAKSYSFFTGANHLESGIPLGTPGAIISSGLILPLNICVGLVVACTMYAFYTLFRKGGM
jgi:multisubunit Na+/H+ antiporter MnhB subunit